MKKILCIAALLFCMTSVAQNETTDQSTDVLEKYMSYFELPRETLYTHLNKTAFIAGENIWFKTYAFDRHSDKVSKNTTNINVGIYDDTGKLVKKDLWLAVNGSGYGNISIDSTFKTGDYYLKASTNWMRNFKEDDAFVQKISILGNETTSEKDSITNTLDVQFLPEGGHIIADAPNVIGLKILNKNAKGVALEGTIYDNENTEISTFKTNNFGIGKFFLTPKIGKSYSAVINLNNGTIITRPIDGIKNRGITLQVNTLNSEKLVLTFNTNTATHDAIKTKTYTVLLHKNGRLKTIPFSFDSELSKTIAISKSELFSDVNSITVLDEENRPFMERLVFNHNFKTSTVPYNIIQLGNENDSLVFSIYKLSKAISDTKPDLSNLSISVLPKTTAAYNPEDNILSANYLRPYLKGEIESPSYYFNDRSNKKDYDLDMLLLTQGWSRYDWASIFENTPKALYPSNNGVTLQGKIHSSETIEMLKMRTPEPMGKGWLDLKIKPDNTFELENFYAYNDEVIRLSYLDDKGKLKKPKLYTNFLRDNFNDTLQMQYRNKKRKLLAEASLPEMTYNAQIFNPQETQELNEVYIETDRAYQKEIYKKYNLPSFTFKNNYTQITPEIERRTALVSDFIRARGTYFVSADRSAVNPGEPLRIIKYNKSSPASNGVPVVFFDGVRLLDFSILANMRLADVEGISIDTSGLGYGLTGGGEGVIRIFSRITPLRTTTVATDNYANRVVASNGFTKAKAYYAPKYMSYSDDFFKYYGAVSWLPNINVADNSSELIKLPNTNSEGLTFFIEGLDAQGNLVSQSVTIDLDLQK